jgi:glycosyltransferase involved in cell wall biosynthesis
VQVLHVITTLERGGAENHLLQLAKGQVASGIEVRVAFLKGTAELAEEFAAFGVTPVKVNQIRNLFRLRTLKPDVLHAHLPRAELFGYLISGRASAFVVSRHNTEPFWPSGPSLVSKLLTRLVDHRSTRLIAISNAVLASRSLSDGSGLSSKIRLIPYGFEIPVLQAQGQPPSGNGSLLKPENGPVQLRVVARLAPQKDLPTLLRATAILKERRLDVELDVAGAGPDLNALIAMTEDLCITQQVHFVGRIDSPVEFIAKGDIFVLPSIYEGFGLVLLEASAAQVPIIAARNTAMIEVVIDEVTGLLFETGDSEDLADKLQDLISDREKGRRLACAAYERLVSVYRPESMVQKTLAVYREAISTARD